MSKQILTALLNCSIALGSGDCWLASSGCYLPVYADLTRPTTPSGC